VAHRVEVPLGWVAESEGNHFMEALEKIRLALLRGPFAHGLLSLID
jgi:hypothetical protein